MFETQFNIMILPDYLTNPGGRRKFIPTKPDEFIRQTRELLIDVSKSQTGNIVLNTLRVWNSITFIIPVQVTDPDECGGAQADPSDYNLLWNTQISKIIPRTFRMGSVVTVKILPANWTASGACSRKHSTDPKFADFVSTGSEVLNHELVHAIRRVSKTYNQEPLTGTRLQDLYGGMEGFIAVLVDNIFRSERDSNLRLTHHDFHRLDADFSTSFDYFKISKGAFSAVDKFCKENPNFTRRLCHVKAKYNPIAAYFQDRKKCQEISASSSSP